MESRFFSALLLFCLFTCLMFLALNHGNVEASSNATLTVPDQYATIQQAINAANPGDTIYIKNGTYHEHVSVNKTLQLIGENNEASIIDGGSLGTVMTVNAGGMFGSADNTTIANLTVTNSGNGTLDCGLMLNTADNCNITNVHAVANNGLGIWLSNSGHNTIEDTPVQNNGLTGILVTAGSENNIFNNTVSNNTYGIVVTSNSSGNFVVSNNVAESAWFGIDIVNSSKNSVRLNYIEESQRAGIMIEQSSDNLVYSNNVTDNNVGIWLNFSSSNTVRNNDVQDNSLTGAWFANSSINSFLENDVAHNNGYGFWINFSNNNSIFHNNIISNLQDVYINTSINAWDGGSPYSDGGNYWSNYTGSDQNADGIGDSPHVLDAKNVDHYPLIGQFLSFDLARGTLELITNSNIEDLNYLEANSTIEMHVSNATTDQTQGFARFTIPYTLINAPEISVIVDDGATPLIFYNTTYQNETFRWIYVEFPLTTHKIDLIPEFPSFLTLTSVMTGTLITLTLHRTRRKQGKD